MKLSEIIKTMEQAFEKDPNNYPSWHDFEYDEEWVKIFIQNLEGSNQFSDFDILEILSSYDVIE